MKRIITAILALVLVIGTTAFAEQVTLDKPTTSGDEVTITGSIPQEYVGQNVSLQIIKPDGSFGNIADIFYLREVASEENGNFSHSFTMPATDVSGNDTTGTYVVYAGSKGLDASVPTRPDVGEDYTQSFFYCTPTGRAEFIQDVEDAANETDLVTLLTGAEGKKILTQIGLLPAEYNDLDATQQTAVNSKLLTATFDAEADFIKAYNDAIILEIVNANLADNAAAMEEVRVFSEYLGINYIYYDGLQTDDLTFFNQCVNSAKGSRWQSADSFKKAITDALALIDINSVTDYRNIWTTIEKYIANLGFTDADLEYYEALTAEGDIYEINKALTNKGFTTVTAVNTAFENAIAADKKKKSQPTYTPPSGGGGGGIALGSGTPSVTPTVTPDTENPFFNDVAETHWAYECIKELKEKGVLNGDEKGNFNPEQTLTREIFVTMLSLGINLPTGDSAQGFADVAAGAWYEDYIKMAAKANIVRGVDGENFGVGMEISRQDMAVMIYRAAKYMNIELMPEDAGVAFADDSDIAIYAKEAVYVLKNSGMISGIDAENFAPTAKSTKAQAARLIYNLINAK